MSARLPVWARAFVVLVVVLAAQAALACPVCGTAKAENDWAFGLTTLLLSFAAPGIFGGIVFYIVRAHRKAARDDEADVLRISRSISTPD